MIIGCLLSCHETDHIPSSAKEWIHDSEVSEIIYENGSGQIELKIKDSVNYLLCKPV